MKVDVGIDTEVGDGTNKTEKGVSRVVVCEEVKEKNGDRKRLLWDSDPSDLCASGSAGLFSGTFARPPPSLLTPSV